MHVCNVKLDLTTPCVCGFQFAVLMWLLTYVGALFNGLTLLILGEVIPNHYTSRSSVLSPTNFQASLLLYSALFFSVTSLIKT